MEFREFQQNRGTEITTLSQKLGGGIYIGIPHRSFPYRTFTVYEGAGC